MNSFIVLVIFHVIGDFYLQNDRVAKDKRKINTSMIMHSLIYSIPFIIFSIAHVIDPLLLIIIIFSHVFIDICTVEYKNKYKEREFEFFCIDQFLHLAIIYFCTLFMNVQNVVTNQFLVLFLAILILIKPISVFISLAFKSIFKNENNTNDLKIGRYIGYLERIIIFILCGFNSISTIGFVIAAKTLVRYKDINDNQNHFQEKYLIGTLLSTIGALCCYGLVKFINN